NKSDRLLFPHRKSRWNNQLLSLKIDLLHKSAFCTLVGKGIHLYWEKGKYQTFPPFPFPFSLLLLEV
ncbi:hypothetical protein VF02_08165, partial [Nostoc linckia z1]